MIPKYKSLYQFDIKKVKDANNLLKNMFSLEFIFKDEKELRWRTRYLVTEYQLNQISEKIKKEISP